MKLGFNNIMKAQPSDKSSRRFSIFKQQLFQTATPFTHVPLHFHRPTKPSIILDHSQTHPAHPSSRPSRPRSTRKPKLFDNQRCFSTISHGREDRTSNRSSIESGERRRRHTIFKCESMLNTLQVREGSDCPPQDMITRPQSTRPEVIQLEDSPILVRQAMTEVEGKQKKGEEVEERTRKRTEGELLGTIDSNIIHPLQFAKMMKEIRSNKNRRARVNYPIPRMPYSPLNAQWDGSSYMDHHGWVYHI